MKLLVVFVTFSAFCTGVKSLEDKVSGTCNCPLYYGPVCGSNGKTYSNDCILSCQTKRDPDIRFSHNGECEKPTSDQEQEPKVAESVEEVVELETPCACFRIYSPVCGSDKKIYSNKCELDCAKIKDPQLKMVGLEECNEISSPCMCTRQYDPYCGNDGVTYSNKCELECKQRLRSDLKIAKKGKC